MSAPDGSKRQRVDDPSSPSPSPMSVPATESASTHAATAVAVDSANISDSTVRFLLERLLASHERLSADVLRLQSTVDSVLATLQSPQPPPQHLPAPNAPLHSSLQYHDSRMQPPQPPSLAGSHSTPVIHPRSASPVHMGSMPPTIANIVSSRKGSGYDLPSPVNMPQPAMAPRAVRSPSMASSAASASPRLQHQYSTGGNGSSSSNGGGFLPAGSAGPSSHHAQHPPQSPRDYRPSTGNPASNFYSTPPPQQKQPQSALPLSISLPPPSALSRNQGYSATNLRSSAQSHQQQQHNQQQQKQQHHQPSSFMLPPPSIPGSASSAPMSAPPIPPPSSSSPSTSRMQQKHSGYGLPPHLQQQQPMSQSRHPLHHYHPVPSSSSSYHPYHQQQHHYSQPSSAPPHKTKQPMHMQQHQQQSVSLPPIRASSAAHPSHAGHHPAAMLPQKAGIPSLASGGPPYAAPGTSSMSVDATMASAATTPSTSTPTKPFTTSPPPHSSVSGLTRPQSLMSVGSAPMVSGGPMSGSPGSGKKPSTPSSSSKSTFSFSNQSVSAQQKVEKNRFQANIRAFVDQHFMSPANAHWDYQQSFKAPRNAQTTQQIVQAFHTMHGGAYDRIEHGLSVYFSSLKAKHRTTEDKALLKQQRDRRRARRIKKAAGRRKVFDQSQFPFLSPEFDAASAFVPSAMSPEHTDDDGEVKVGALPWRAQTFTKLFRHLDTLRPKRTPRPSNPRLSGSAAPPPEIPSLLIDPAYVAVDRSMSDHHLDLDMDMSSSSDCGDSRVY
ncbi:hypothetical protein GQ54DRAFT_303108 [Martensiomyces pterosporus]|nr:hypothetical protein GQ54DRAFT_303108 [Martensiomyces pterosporus]